MEIRITSAVNGYVLERTIEGEKQHFAFGGESSDEVDVCADMLRFILSEMGPCTSRYADKRIYIVIKPGDKNEKFTEEDSAEIWPDTDTI